MVKTTVKFDLTTNIVVETILLNTLLGLRIERVAENNLMIISDIAEKFVTVKDIALDFDPMRDFGITMNVNNIVVGVKFDRDGLKTFTAAVVLDKIELETILLNTLLGLRKGRVAENSLIIIADIAGKLVTVKDIALDFDPMRVWNHNECQ